MSYTRLLLLSFVCALALVSSAAAQDSAPAAPSHAETTTVTTIATADRVRFAAPNAVVQLRLEVYDEPDRRCSTRNSAVATCLIGICRTVVAKRVADGSYLCVVTVKNLSGPV